MFRISFSTSRTKRLRWSALPLLALLNACGGGGDSGPDASSADSSVAAISTSGAGDTGNYFPLNDGDRWVYHDSGNSTDETVLVAGSRSVNGKLATVVRTTLQNGTASEDYYVKSAGSVALIGDDSGDADNAWLYPLRVLTLPVNINDTFVQLDKKGLDYGEDVDGDGRHEQIEIHSEVKVLGTEAVTTPAGDFNAMKVQTVLKETIILSRNGERHIGTITATEWYQSGVGLVKRTIVDNFEGDVSSSDIALLAYEVGGRRSESVSPTVVSSQPGTTVTQAHSTAIQAQLSEAMRADTLNTNSFTVVDGSGQRINGTVSFDAYLRVASFWPATPLLTGTYTAQLTADARDLAGNPLTAYSWSFTIEGGPTVVSTVPAANATGAARSPTIVIELNKAIDPTAINQYAVSVTDDQSTPQSATVTLQDATHIAVTLLTALPRDAVITVSVSAPLVRDLLGNPMSANYSWRFTTASGAFLATATLATRTDALSPQAIAVGDMTGDGRDDVVMVGESGMLGAINEARLWVYAQATNGQLGEPTAYRLAGGTCGGATSVSIGDVDGDGRGDVVVGEGACGFEVFHQASDGTLVSTGRIDTNNGDKLRIADLNHDGRLDIVGVGRATNTVSVWLQDGQGRLGSPTVYAVNHNGNEDIEVGDINNDGLIDIVVLNNTAIGVLSSSSVGVLIQQPGGFAAASYHGVRGTQGVNGLAIGDVNHDGLNDIVVTSGGNRPSSLLEVLVQQPGGGFASSVTLASYDIPVAVEIADMNNDGLLDVVVLHHGFASLGLYEQASDGSLKPEVLYATPAENNNPQALAVGDINGDGLKDVAIASTQSTVALLRHAPLGTSAPAAVTAARPLNARAFGAMAPFRRIGGRRSQTAAAL
jgi:hypothetical protein